MARISAAEAEQIVRADLDHQRRMGQANLPRTPQLLNDLMHKGVFPICNVGPWAYPIERGCIRMFIPAYDPKSDTKGIGCAMSDSLPAVRTEAYITGGGGDQPLTWGNYFDDGRIVAMDLIGIGAGLKKENSLVQYGVFVPAGPLPTKEEIAGAVEQLELYADYLVQESREAFDKGRETWNQTRSDRHLWAGRRRGIQEKWVSEDHQEQSVRCDMCGKFNPAGIAKCQCGRIIDFELYAKIEREQGEMMELARSESPKRK